MNNIHIILILIALLLMALGGIGIWLAMHSPIQLQPIPAITFFVGFLLAIGVIASWP